MNKKAVIAISLGLFVTLGATPRVATPPALNSTAYAFKVFISNKVTLYTMCVLALDAIAHGSRGPGNPARFYAIPKQVIQWFKKPLTTPMLLVPIAMPFLYEKSRSHRRTLDSSGTAKKLSRV